MSVPPVQCVYVTEDCVREWKTGNSSLKVSQPVPMLRFLYELAWTMVRYFYPNSSLVFVNLGFLLQFCNLGDDFNFWLLDVVRFEVNCHFRSVK